jgi:hypothetical protein
LGGEETISFYHNGSAKRSWRGPAEPGVIQGQSVGRISEKDYAELVAELRTLDYTAQKDSYRGSTHDADGHVLTVLSPTKEKTIVDAMGGAPVQLAQFFDLVRKKAATLRWRPQ